MRPVRNRAQTGVLALAVVDLLRVTEIAVRLARGLELAFCTGARLTT